MRIKVAWEDMVDGDTGEPMSCAIAQAIRRQRPEVRRVAVTASVVRWHDSRTGNTIYYDMPRNARSFIKAFDTGKIDKSREYTFLFDERTRTERTPVKRPPGYYSRVSRRHAQIRAAETEQDKRNREAKAAARKRASRSV